MTKTRKTIGVMVGGITDDFTRFLCKGLREAAKEQDVNMVVLPGKFLDRDYAQNTDIMYEYQYDTLFSSVQKGRLDGIIVAANCIGCYTTKERMVEFMHHYDGIPCVLVSSDLEGYVNVSYDNDRGIRQGINYLVQDLHYTKIGMVGGTKENSDAMERKATFESALWKNGILPQEKRYVEGDLTGNAHSAYARLLDDNPDLEADFCVNDETAAGFYEELKARGLMPGRDISVFGYDDTEWCSQIYPTLSSVRADVSKLGSKACELLCRMMQGEKVSSVRLPTDLVIRNSFCRGNQEEVDARIDVLEKYESMNHWADELFGKQKRVNFEMKNFILKLLCFEKGTDQSFGEILATMEWLKIHNAFLYIYEEPVIHLNHELFQMPEQLLLKASELHGNVENIPAIHQKKKAKNIFRFSRLGMSDRAWMVTLPLYANEMLYGILVCDLTDEVLEYGEFLSNQISAAVKMLNLLKNNENIQKQLEESLYVLKENNLELETLSKKDPLTGICNRRGFFEYAEPMLKKARAAEKTFLVLYADMNNLKIINDRYGHEEGDYSLHTIAEILAEIVQKEQTGDGVVARIGGDEYACALMTEKKKELLLQELYDAFTVRNEQSDKPYNVTVSIGACALEPGDEHSLADALSLADEQLYEVKKLRKKDVAKIPLQAEPQR